MGEIIGEFIGWYSINCYKKRNASIYDLQTISYSNKEANYQAHAIIGGIAPSYKSDDRIPMSLLINILGGPALNSRLNLSVREKHG
ncbi:MAG: hypothetical protein EBQ94_01340 [Flavobacteriales bacterium]|nr:hypothetical protein [Flavobacteriales bacterium]